VTHAAALPDVLDKVRLFYASFIPGLQNFIAEVIKERLADAVIHKLLDGAVIFETETSYDKLNFFCFNNIFACISIMEHIESSTALEKHIREFTVSETAEEIIANNSANFHTFRIVVSNENKPASIDENLRIAAEKRISRLSGLKVDRANPDAEFWFLFRRDDSHGGKNFSVFMKRLTLRPSWENSLHRGELPPPLAWTLCRFARLSHKDTVLDPFCGYGSIPEAAFKHFHVNNFIACDSDRDAFLFSAARFKKRKNAGFIIHNADFELLPSLVAEKSIDAIVTDPPWGQFKEIDDRFYIKMFGVFEKMLKDGGRAVVLCANKDTVVKAASGCFSLQDSIPILLSGKKTVIFHFLLKNR
jgi:tRNA G10  N-methylase Trm11